MRKPGTTEDVRKQAIPLDPGSLVIFNGDKLWHAVTPLEPREERIVLTLQYVTDQEMRPLHRAFSNLKDVFGYFGPAALLRQPKLSQATTSQADRVSDHATLQFLAGAGGAPFNSHF
jgi:hypothetical protein